MERNNREGNRWLTSILKICVSLGLVAFILKQVGWQQTYSSLQKAQLSYILAAFGLYLIGVAVRAYRWQILLDAVGIQVALSRLTALYFIGTFFNNFLPTGIGGDVVRIYELARESERLAESVGTVVMDRFAGLLVLFFMALVALVLNHRLVSPQVSIAIVLLFLVGWGGMGLLLQRDWLERWGFLRILTKIGPLKAVYDSMYACGFKAIGGAFALSVFFNALLIAVNYLIALSLGVHISLWYFLLFIPLISFLLVLPVSLSGLGVRESGYVYLFTQAGVSGPVALTMSLIFYALTVATGLIGGLLYILEGVYGLRIR